MTIEKRNITNVFVLLLLLLISFAIMNNLWMINNLGMIVTFLSIGLLFFQLYYLNKKYNVPLISLISLFIIALHVFHFGFFYLAYFEKTEYFIMFGNYFSADIEQKFISGLFCLCAIQAIYTGIGFGVSRNKRKISDYKFMIPFSNKSKENILFTTGIIVLLIALPCRLYWDFNQILLGQAGSSYVGGYSSSGLIDDIAVVFAPAIMCIMYSKKNKKLIAKILFGLYILYSLLVMTLSGTRRAYITSLLAMFIFYYNVFYKKRNKHVNIVTVIGIFLLTMFMLNFLSFISSSRHTELTIKYLTENINLFSLDFIWNAFAEFGITGVTTYLAVAYIPRMMPFKYGFTFFTSFFYILPVGWLINFNLTGGDVIYELSQKYTNYTSGLGTSVISDLYLNFGWVGILVACFIGYIIGAIIYIPTDSEHGSVSLKTIVHYSLGITIINYARGSTNEIVRNAVYIYLLIISVSYLLSRKKQRL